MASGCGVFTLHGTPSCVYREQWVCGLDRTVLSPQPGSDTRVSHRETLVTRGGVGGAADNPLQRHLVPHRS